MYNEPRQEKTTMEWTPFTRSSSLFPPLAMSGKSALGRSPLASSTNSPLRQLYKNLQPPGLRQHSILSQLQGSALVALSPSLSFSLSVCLSPFLLVAPIFGTMETPTAVHLLTEEEAFEFHEAFCLVDRDGDGLFILFLFLGFRAVLHCYLPSEERSSRGTHAMALSSSWRSL